MSLLLTCFTFLVITKVNSLKVMPFGDSITTCCHECQVQPEVVAPPFRRYLVERLKPWNGYVNTLWHMIHQHDNTSNMQVHFVGRVKECMRNSSKVNRVPRTWDLQYEGYYGQTIKQLQGYLPGALELNPDVILLHAGTNDLIDPKRHGNRPLIAMKHLKYLVDTMLKHPSVQHVFVAQIIPFIIWSRRVQRTRDFSYHLHHPIMTAMEREVALYNQHIVRTFSAKGYEGKVTVVDMNSGFNVTTYLHGDGLHPNEKGEIHLAMRWYQAIQNYLNPTAATVTNLPAATTSAELLVLPIVEKSSFLPEAEENNVRSESIAVMQLCVFFSLCLAGGVVW
eukprot:PhF_6_TR19932/c0_g1_i1/m.28999